MRHAARDALTLIDHLRWRACRLSRAVAPTKRSLAQILHAATARGLRGWPIPTAP